jgi:hypothetical protein
MARVPFDQMPNGIKSRKAANYVKGDAYAGTTAERCNAA